MRIKTGILRWEIERAMGDRGSNRSERSERSWRGLESI
jgi:hypothetical protein